MTDKPARPWDLFKKELKEIPAYIPEARMEICRKCTSFLAITNMCKECGCIMPAKTKLVNASCPIGRWNVVSKSLTVEGEIHHDGLPKP